jgi:transaldolase/glucose-6-phosphate isomerase
LIDDDGLCGVTSNPAIFEKAISGSSDYDAELLTSGHLARSDAKFIYTIQTLISGGINVNVTLLFAQEAYAQVAEAYLAGLEARAASGADVASVASVASFFVSRIDTLVDARLAARAAAVNDDAERAAIRSLLGKVAIANAKLAYQKYLALYRGARWERLAASGAQTQRLLWASTGTKNPAYRDVYYVEELIGPETVNTVPPATFDAFRDHGQVRATLTSDIEAARETMTTLAQVGISITEVTGTLLDEAVRRFAEPFGKLLAAIETRRRETSATALNGLAFESPPGASR